MMSIHGYYILEEKARLDSGCLLHEKRFRFDLCEVKRKLAGDDRAIHQ